MFYFSLFCFHRIVKKVRKKWDAGHFLAEAFLSTSLSTLLWQLLPPHRLPCFKDELFSRLWYMMKGVHFSFWKGIVCASLLISHYVLPAVHNIHTLLVIKNYFTSKSYACGFEFILVRRWLGQGDGLVRSTKRFGRNVFFFCPIHVNFELLILTMYFV